MKIKAISISDRKGIRKKNISKGILIENFGLENDAHGGTWHRQVSLLAQESIDSMRAKGLDVVAGNFAENITTEGIDLTTLKVGSHMLLGQAEIIVSQIGKVCHHKCAIYHQAGDCVMPREGIFGVVIKGGEITIGEPVIPRSAFSPAVAVVGTADTEQLHGKKIREILKAKLNPGFIRFDIVRQDGSNGPEILEDLTGLQQIDTIIVLDDLHSMALSLLGYARVADKDQTYLANRSTIHYCKTVEEMNRLSP